MKKCNAKKKHALSWFVRILSLFSLCFGLCFLGMLKYLNILPWKYFLVLCAIFVLFFFLPVFLLFLRHRNRPFLLFLFAWNLLFLIIFSIGISYLFQTFHFMDLIRSRGYQTETYYVIVRKNEFSSISEIQEIGIPPFLTAGGEEAKLKLSQMGNFSFQDYQDSLSLMESFINKKISSLFLDAMTHEVFLEEYSKYEEIAEVIETIDISVKVEESQTDVDITKTPFHIFISGIDTYGSITRVSRSDVNMIMSVNPITHEILLTSIPRDYYVQLHGTSGYKDKLTHAGIYGIDKSVSTIEDLFGIDINYYLRVNFNTLVKLVDTIGGIEINSDSSFTAWTNSSCSITKGYQTLNGECALAYSRERKSYASGDRHRVQNQQDVLMAVLTKITTSRTLITNYTNILNALSESFQTNMEMNRITSFLQYQIEESPTWKFGTQSVDGSGEYQYTYSIPGTKLYVMVPDYQTVNAAKMRLEELMMK